jgi:peptidoglycan/xylan/chitin deacetylase (PgdA/CDA1 family)
LNFFGGPALTRVPHARGRVFLTFDDGPWDSSTPALLDFCARENVPATFFLVADRARREPALTRAIRDAGHALGNHSLDHRYTHYFRSRPHLRTWITHAQAELTEIAGASPIAFRSPAGVRTPELRAALDDCGLPLVHWNHRFFDAVMPFTTRAAVKAAKRARDGDIFLLHDIPRDGPQFLGAVTALVRDLRTRGLEPAALTPGDVRA